MFKKQIQKLLKLFSLEKRYQNKFAFYDAIRDYYSRKIDDDFPKVVIDDLSKYLGDLLYYKYKHISWEHSELKNEYLRLLSEEHFEGEFIKDRIIYFLKTNYNNQYRYLCSKLFNLTQDEFLMHERKREAFENM